MATDTHKYVSHAEQEARHSALQEFSRDERRPAVLLLSALVLAVLFFAMGLLVGRWTATPDSSTNAAVPGAAVPASTPAGPVSQPATSPATNTSGATVSDAEHRFALLVATYDAPEKAQPLIKTLQEAGYTEIRTSSPPAGQAHPRYSLLVGRFTQDEAREAARRMRSTNDPRLKSAKVIEEQ